MGKKAALVFQQPQRLHLGLSYPHVQYFACDLDELKTQWEVCEQTTTGHLKKLRIKQEIIGKITYFCHTHWQVTIFCKFTINWENVLIQIVYKQVSLFVLSAFYITEVKIFARGFMFRNRRCVK